MMWIIRGEVMNGLAYVRLLDIKVWSIRMADNDIRRDNGIR